MIPDKSEKEFSLIRSVSPGIASLLERLEKSPVFQQRFEEIDERKPKKPRVDYGYKIRTIRSAVPMKKEIRPLKKKIKTLEPKDLKEKEPLIDVFEGKEEIKIVAELPSVKDIKTDLRGEKLIISAKNFYKEIALPCPVERMKKRYKNGILEIRLKLLR